MHEREDGQTGVPDRDVHGASTEKKILQSFGERGASSSVRGEDASHRIVVDLSLLGRVRLVVVVVLVVGDLRLVVRDLVHGVAARRRRGRRRPMTDSFAAGRRR